MATTHGRDLIDYIDLAAQNDGAITGLRVKIIADIGAYQTLFGAAIPTFTQAMLSGVYTVPAIRADLTDVFTNKTPTDAYRGAGRPEGIYFVERAVDMLAAKLDMDPAELRRKNFIQPGQFPFETQAGSVYDSGEYERLLDKTLELADWEGLKTARDAARAEGSHRWGRHGVLRGGLRHWPHQPFPARRLGARLGHGDPLRRDQRNDRRIGAWPGPRDHLRPAAVR